MLDLKAIRSDPDAARAALARRGDEAATTLDRALSLDARRRALLPELEELRADKNAASKRIGELQREGEDASEAIAEVRGGGRAREGARCRAARGRAGARRPRSAALPNLPDPDAADEDTVLREVGEAGAAGRDHLELLGGLVDLEAGARVAGSRFAYLKGPLVLLELALVRWALELLGGHGFVPVVPPVLVREEALYRHRHAARHRAADLPRARRRPLPGGHQRGAAGVAARRRDAGRGGAAAALRRASPPASGARRARPARTRAGSSACTSSTRSRCSRS